MALLRKKLIDEQIEFRFRITKSLNDRLAAVTSRADERGLELPVRERMISTLEKIVEKAEAELAEGGSPETATNSAEQASDQLSSI